MRRASSRDVARRAGVSQSTVSRVLNKNISDKFPISEDTIARVLQAVDELDYEPNLAARSLRTRQTMMIGVLFDDIDCDLSTEILSGILTVLNDAGYHILVRSSEHDEERTRADVERDRECVHWFRAQQVEAIIIVDSRANLALPEDDLDSGDVPMVFINRIWENEEMSNHTFVYPDSIGGGYLATHHLIALGHQRIGYINGPEERCTCGGDRLTGFRNALAEANLVSNPEWVLRGDWSAESGYAAGQKLLSRNNRPTAIFAANDYMAIGCIAAARNLGLDVPEDLAVVGFDNRDVAIYTDPALTTVTLPGLEMGRGGAELVIAAARGEAFRPGGTIVPSKLIVRNSCGSNRVPKGKWLRGSPPASITALSSVRHAEVV